MTEVLNQNEIDKLLEIISKGEVTLEETDYTKIQKNIAIYDFKRPWNFSIHIINRLHEIFSTVSKDFSNYLNNTSLNKINITVSSLDQLNYVEYKSCQADDNTNCKILMESTKTLGFIQIDLSEKLKKFLITSAAQEKEITEIIAYLIEAIRLAFSEFVDVKLKLHTIDDKNKIQIVKDIEMGILITLDIKDIEIQEFINIFLPFNTIKSLVKNITLYKKISSNKHIKTDNIPIQINTIVKEIILPLYKVVKLKKGDIITWKP